MRTQRSALCVLAAVVSVLLASTVEAQSIGGKAIVGYADRFSVQPGESIKFMVSSELPQYRAEIVRLIHGDTNPRGPGVKEELVDTPVNKDYPGAFQPLPNGSYVSVPDNVALQLSGSFTLQAWIYPTTPQKGAQGILGKWSEAEGVGYGLFLDENGSVALWIGDGDRVEKVGAGKPLRPFVAAHELIPGRRRPLQTSRWYFVAATFDASNGTVVVYQEPQQAWPGEQTLAVVEQTIELRAAGANGLPFLIGAAWQWGEAEQGLVGAHFNGRIEAPRVFSSVLSHEELTALKQGREPSGAIAAWDFSAGIGTRKVTDRGPNRLDGRTVNMPTRAVTGHSWTGHVNHFELAPDQYAAIHFHDDDLDDAKWDVGFEWLLPAGQKSGIYAARLRGGNAEDYIPFFVRPPKGTATAQTAFLVPTFSYLAYANSGTADPRLLSCYDKHSDGNGVAYSSRLRPIMNLRPKVASTWGALTFPHQLNADLHLTDWLEARGHNYDVITDEDLHWEGAALLAPYNVVITGSHPEYWSGEMLDSLETYLNDGGRLMYLGGNGFYWVTNIDPEQRHTIEVRRWGGTQAWEAVPGNYHLSTTGEMGGLWRFRGRPPQQLVGVGFSAQGSGHGVGYVRQPAASDPRVAFIFEGIGPDEIIGDHSSLVMEHGAAGFEVDRADFGLGTPPNTLILATATGLPTCDGAPCQSYKHVVEAIYSSNSGPLTELQKADMVYIEYPNGGAVFSVGSISWDGSLSYNDYNNNVSQLTGNVLRRFASDGPLGEPSGSAAASR